MEIGIMWYLTTGLPWFKCISCLFTQNANIFSRFWKHRVVLCTYISNYSISLKIPDFGVSIIFSYKGVVQWYDLKLILNPNFVKSLSPITSVPVVQSFENVAKSTALSLPSHCRALCRFQNNHWWISYGRTRFTRFGFKMSFGWICGGGY